jgi:hypothetical protein
MQTVILPSQMTSALDALRLTPEEALRRFLSAELTLKLREYHERCRTFEHQYQSSYHDFTKSVEDAPTEDFARSDDRNAWQFALEAESVIRERLQELQ